MQNTRPHSNPLLDTSADEPSLACVLGRNVETLRERAHISKSCFAAMVGIGRPQLNKIEKGTVDVRLSVVERLADALDTSPAKLLGFEE